MNATPALFPRHIAIFVIMGVACAFAANHVAARFAFDHGAGLLLAILCRSGATLLVLAGLVWWQRETLRLPPGTAGWQLLLGLLIAVQSLCLYSAVARIPVALALLISNTFPILLALFTWALGWGIGGSLIDAGLINAGVYSLEGGQLGTAAKSVAAHRGNDGFGAALNRGPNAFGVAFQNFYGTGTL